MAVSIAALAVGAGIAIYGIVKKNQAAKKAKANQRPTYEIPQEEYDMQRLAENQANQGISPQSRQYYQNQADQGLSTTTDAILRGGGDPNSVSNAYSQYEKGINNLSVYDDQTRMKHLEGLSSAYARKSADKDKQYQINTYGKWADTAQALAAEQAGAQQTINSGINIAGQGLGGIASAATAPKADNMPQQQAFQSRERNSIDTLPINSGYGSGMYSPPQQPMQGASMGDGVGYGWGWSGGAGA